jgi:hypothetical protein
MSTYEVRVRAPARASGGHGMRLDACSRQPGGLPVRGQAAAEHPSLAAHEAGCGQDGKPKDLTKNNDFLSVAVDSMRRLFSKSEDEYPMKEPALGFTMTPTKAQRNKVGPCTPRFCRWHGYGSDAA